MLVGECRAVTGDVGWLLQGFMQGLGASVSVGQYRDVGGRNMETSGLEEDLRSVDCLAKREALITE